MNITAKCFTSVRYTQEQLKSMRQRIQLVSTNPVNFFYLGEKLEIDHIGVHVKPQRYGFDLVFSDVLKFPNIPEGHEVIIQMISTNGEPDYERYIGSFNLMIAKLTPEIRFHEFLTAGYEPHPQFSDIGSVMHSVVEIAEMLDSTDYGLDFADGKYSIHLNKQCCASDHILENLHAAFLSTIAVSTKEKLCQSSL